MPAGPKEIEQGDGAVRTWRTGLGGEWQGAAEAIGGGPGVAEHIPRRLGGMGQCRRAERAGEDKAAWRLHASNVRMAPALVKRPPPQPHITWPPPVRNNPDLHAIPLVFVVPAAQARGPHFQP